jgi:hypothetical protein
MAKHRPFGVWTPADFLDLGSRSAVDKALQRLAKGGTIRRIDRGLYDQPRPSTITGELTAPDYRHVIDAIARRDQARMLIDGMTAANDLGLTDAVPARVVVHTDMRRRSIRLGKLTIAFKRTSPSRLYWAGRPAMRVVQALHWMKDIVRADTDKDALRRLRTVLNDPKHGAAIRADLAHGLSTLPAWTQHVARNLLGSPSSRHEGAAGTKALHDDDHHDRSERKSYKKRSAVSRAVKNSAAKRSW